MEMNMKTKFSDTKKDIAQLVKQKTWLWLNYNETPPVPDGKPWCVLKDTWSFKLKRLPGGSHIKYKPRYCVHDDLQTAGVVNAFSSTVHHSPCINHDYFLKLAH